MNRRKYLGFIIGFFVLASAAIVALAATNIMSWYQDGTHIADENGANLVASTCISPTVTDDTTNNRVNITMDYTCPTPTPTQHILQLATNLSNSTSTLSPISTFTFTFSSGKGVHISCNLLTSSASTASGVKIGWSATPAAFSVGQSMYWSTTTSNATVTSDSSFAFGNTMISPLFQVTGTTILQRYDGLFIDFSSPQTVSLAFADTDNASSVNVLAGSVCLWSSQ